jgi:hypothetical protein
MIDHTIVGGNFRRTGTTKDDINGTVTASWSLVGTYVGSNLIEAAPDANGNLIGGDGSAGHPTIDPMLGFLTNNGGRTLTCLPQVGSPAIDHGDPNFNKNNPDGNPATNDAVPNDQRGNPNNIAATNFDRVVGGRIDIGAIEVQQRPAQGATGPTDPLINVYGDYNRDGVVNTTDYPVWRDHLKQSFVFNDSIHLYYVNGYWLPNEDPAQTDPFQNGGNGSKGVVDAVDYAFWKLRFGKTDNGPGSGAAAYVPGDFNHDGIVNNLDQDIWYDTVGSPTDLRADANFDGIVDLTDLQICQEEFGVTTLDSLTTFGDLNSDFVVDSADMTLAASSAQKALVTANFGTVRADIFPTITLPRIINGTDRPPLDILGAAPVVLDVMVGGSGAAYDFAGLVGSGEQLRSIAQTNPNAISIRFSEEVLVSTYALSVINLDGTSPGTATSFTYDLSTETATWTFGTTLADGRYLLRLVNSVSNPVFDLSHDALDGEFTNPWTLTASDDTSSVFPSGDGTAGGEFRFRFTVMAADTDHDNVSGSTNYQNWHSYEPGMILVSTTADDYDVDLSYGDVSLREAVNYANTASEATTIALPTGRYVLTRVGTEGTDTAYNDLDVLKTMTVTLQPSEVDVG